MPLSKSTLNQKRSGDPKPPVFFQKYCRTNGSRTAVQMGGVLQYKWEAYCRVSLLRSLEARKYGNTNGGGVLPYKLEVYCRTFFATGRGWGFRNLAHSRLVCHTFCFGPIAFSRFCGHEKRVYSHPSGDRDSDHGLRPQSLTIV